nr:DUF4258 domain-containing protein [uncultured Methanoregula sp.]
MHNPLTYTIHARTMMQERMIQEEWITMTVNNPDFTESKGEEERHYLKRIPDAGEKILRVILNPSVTPHRIITVFFDRRIQP